MCLGYPRNLSKEEAEKSLHELCMKNLDSLTAISLVTMDNELRLLPSEPGRLMARYSIAFETMKKFSNLTGQENLPELVRKGFLFFNKFKFFHSSFWFILHFFTKTLKV